MPLIASAYIAFATGLLAGFSGYALPGAFLLSVPAAAAFLMPPQRRFKIVSVTLMLAAGLAIAATTTPAEGCFEQGLNDRNSARPVRPCSKHPGATPALERVSKTIELVFREDAPMAKALLIANQREIPREVRDQYATAGIIHMLSISGLHVAIIAAAVELLFQIMRLPIRTAAIAAVVVITGYVALIGFPPPAVRSGVMIACASASRIFQRPTSPWAALAVGAFVPLIEPRTILDLGYQLSVAGIAGLIASGAIAKRVLRGRIPNGWRFTITRELMTSVVATLVTAPLVAWTFGRLSIIAPLSNLAAGPVVSLIQPILFLALVFAPILPVAQFIAGAAHPLLYLFDTLARTAASVPFAALDVAPTLLTAVAGAVASAAFVVACVSYFPARPLITALFASAVMVWSPFLPVLHKGQVELHMIDVGQGDALALRTDRGRWIVFDAGRSWRGNDAGKSIVGPYLRRRGGGGGGTGGGTGAGSVHSFILSHPHMDHVGGAASLFKTLKPQNYWDAAFALPNQSYMESLTTARELGIKWHRVHPGDSVQVDGVVITFLAPDSAWATNLGDPNEASTIALVRFGAVKFLFMGDAERQEEEWLLQHARYPGDRLDVDVLKVGHHGSRTSSTERFIAATTPKVALISVGAGNSYGHPDREVIGRLHRAGAQVLRTDYLGDVVVRTDGQRIYLDPW